MSPLISSITWKANLFCQFLSNHRVVRHEESIASNGSEMRESRVRDGHAVVSTEELSNECRRI